MPHYDIKIIDSYELYTSFKKGLKILFIKNFRNSIQTENGYIIILNKKNSNFSKRGFEMIFEAQQRSLI